MIQSFISKYRGLLIYIVIGCIAVLVRAPLIADVPSSPYWEETILGFDAYSLAQTGKDHHGTSWPILALESFGDWKPAGYVYAVVPFVRLFGLELWVVRLPSLLAGLAICVAAGLFAKRLGFPSWIAVFVVAVSPWSIHFSRAAWEANLATALIAWGVLAALSSITEKRISPWLASISVLLFSAAWYTYHAARVVVPLLVLGLLVFVFISIRGKGRQYGKRSIVAVIVSIFVAALCILPLVRLSGSTALTQRFNETGRFSDPSVVLRSNALREAAGYSLISRVAYHRYVLWSGELLKAYGDNLNPVFLFFTGESNLRHTTGTFGLFYPFELLFLIFGIYRWVRFRKPIHALLAYWLAVSLIPAALAVPTPHALRILIGLPVLALVIAEGMSAVIGLLSSALRSRQSNEWLRQNARVLAVSAMLFVYLVGFISFWQHYTNKYPQLSASAWQEGYQEMLSSLELYELLDPALPVYISRSEGRPASYLWFYRKTNPRDVQAANATAKKDQGEFLEYAQYRFFNSVGEIPDGAALLVLSPAQYADYSNSHSLSHLKTIYDSTGRTVWVIVRQ